MKNTASVAWKAVCRRSAMGLMMIALLACPTIIMAVTKADGQPSKAKAALQDAARQAPVVPVVGTMPADDARVKADAVEAAAVADQARAADAAPANTSQEEVAGEPADEADDAVADEGSGAVAADAEPTDERAAEEAPADDTADEVADAGEKQQAPPASPARRATPGEQLANAAGTDASDQDRDQPKPGRAAPKRSSTNSGSDAANAANKAEATNNDAIKALLGGFDPTQLQLSGAPLDVEVVNDQIILRGTEEDVAKVQLLLQMLETREKKVLQVVRIINKDANEVEGIQDTIRDAREFPNRLEEDKVTIKALSSSLLLVSALPQDMDFVLNVIKQVDVKEEPLDVEAQPLVVPIKNRKVTDVAEKLQEILDQLQEAKGVPQEQRVKIQPNPADNSLLIVAPESQHDIIRQYITSLDVAPNKEWGELKLTLFPLLHSEADGLANVITDLLEAQSGQDDTEEVVRRLIMTRIDPDGTERELPPIDLDKPVNVIAESTTNSLIVSTYAGNVEPMRELIRLLDGVALEKDLDIRLFPIKHADAEELAGVIEDMFSAGDDLTQEADQQNPGGVPSNAVGEALVYEFSLATDKRTNTIIAAGRPEQLELCARVVSELDKPTVDLKFPLKLIPVEHTDASRVADVLRDLLQKRMDALEAQSPGAAAVERERVFLSVDLRSNSLLVAAAQENLEELKSLLAQLDIPAQTQHAQVRIVSVGSLNAADLKGKIDELWARKSSIRGELELPEDEPVVIVDEPTNSLLVASSIEDHAEIARLVTALQGQALIDDTHLYALEHADAKALATKLDELFSGLGGTRENFDAPTIIADQRTNTLIAAGDAEAMSRLGGMIEKLDVKAGPRRSASIEVYPLRYASVNVLFPKLQQLFDERQQGGGDEATPFVMLPDESSNSLVVSCSADDHEIVLQLLGLLDRQSDLSRQFEIFPLKQAKATKVEETLNDVFSSSGSDVRVDAIAAKADERTNSIIVWAAPAQMESVAEMIDKLDTSGSTVDRMVKLVQLKRALAEDFATLLEDTLLADSGNDNEQALIVSFLQKRDDGSEILRKLIRQDIKITPDPRTNSLMVMAPAESMEMLEALIAEFDRIGPVYSELRLFPLVNSDAQNMVDQLRDLFDSQASDGETATQLTLGDRLQEIEFPRVGQEVRFSADPRTNTLIAAGAEVDLQMIEELVRYLDSQDIEERVTAVMPAKFKRAQDIATAVSQFNDQEQSIYSQLDDETSQMRLADRQITVEAIGNESEGSQLIVGTSRRSYAQTMEIIQQLDRPEPQVTISVLIAEVTLTDDVELGVEIAGQQLDFSESAFLGPNGVIKGAGFDVVAGTSVGAEGSGQGFNFTLTGEDFGFLFHALQQDSRLEVLSRPLLTVRNGETGKINISDQVPYVQSTQINDTGSTNTVPGYQDVGVVLEATPQISPDGYVTIDLIQEISDFAGETLQLTEGVVQPVIQERRIETNVTVRDGETVVIGGLITSRESEGTSKVPLVGDLPWLGALFRTTANSMTKRELLVVLTVDILSTDEDVRRMSEEQRDKFVLPPSVTSSPLMEGLRIVPSAKNGMGPADGENGDEPIRPQARPTREPKPKYGPRPKVYGPTYVQPASTTSTAQAKPKRVYGPSLKAPQPEEEPTKVASTD